MSTLKVNTIQNTSGSEMYLAKAWVNFSGEGAVSIRAAGNVSSITDNGTGDYTITFTTAFPDTKYAATCGITGVGEVISPYDNYTQTTSNYRINTRRTDSFAPADSRYVNYAFFR